MDLRTRRPYMLQYSASFSQKKRRKRVGLIAVPVYAGFEILKIEVDGPISLWIKTVTSGPVHLSPGEPVKLFPAAEFPPGASIEVALELDPGVALGRKRPIFRVILRGAQIFNFKS